jgi:glycosyltransferase involved in cell wall biosynthesis
MIQPTNKPRVLIFIDYFLPGYKAGGPIKSALNMVKSLSDDFDFTIITSNTDLQSNVPYDTVPSNERVWIDGIKIFYLSKNQTNISTLSYMIKTLDYEFVHFHSLFAPYFTLLPYALVRIYRKDVKILLAPRGMLGANSIKIKYLKKSIFFQITKVINFFKPVVWHASSEIEKIEINSFYGDKLNVKIAPDISILQPIDINKKVVKNVGEVNLFFLSRIQSIKNLDGALRVLEKFTTPGIKIIYDIIGPIQDTEYWQKCQKIIEKIDKNVVVVRYLGGVANTEINKLLLNYHFLYMPTLNENYGHAIVESFSNGCPVIISDKTQWLNLTQQQIGWDIPPDDTQSFYNALNFAINMNNETYKKWSQNCLDFAGREVYNPDIIEQNKQLFV